MTLFVMRYSLACVMNEILLLPPLMPFWMFHSSGKCQIMHWRQGHKQTCQQWHVNGGGNSGGLSPTESSEQMPFLTNLNSPLPGGDSHLHDMNFDTVSEPSFATTDSYILDTDLFPTDRSNMNESNKNLLSRVKGASVASCEMSNYSVDEETNPSEILSANMVAYLLIRFFTLPSLFHSVQYLALSGFKE